MCQTKISQQEE